LFKEKIVLKGNKVTLRPVKRADIPNFLIWFNDPEVTQYMGRFLPLTEMEEEKWVDTLAGDNTRVNFVIEAVGTEIPKAIGTLGFHAMRSKDREATFGIGIGDKEYWSHGYGTEAASLLIKFGFEQLNLHRISSEVFGFNERSQKMHLKLGFKEEGRKRSSMFINGQYWDVVMYGILESEWRELNKG
jgi:RimJ/RimL family protein N-acetyltransferase